MRPRTAITLAALFGVGLCVSRPVLAQQAKVPRRVITKVIPLYPDLPSTMTLDGTVKVTVVVAPNGTASAVKAVGGHPLLLKAAQDAISKWKWAPAREQSTELVELKFHPR
jgi:TonB family protein